MVFSNYVPSHQFIVRWLLLKRCLIFYKQVFLIAGSDSSPVTLEWALSNLLNHPSTLEKLREEIDSCVGQERLMDEEDVSKLPYLKCVILESLRLYPAAPLLVPHHSSAGCNVARYDVPANTMVIVNAWAIHRDPNIWTDSPDQFKPERFMRDSMGGGEVNPLILPFGLGRRACPGAPLAKKLIGLTLGMLIQCFDWRRVDEADIDMDESEGLSMPKLKPLEAMCRERPIRIVDLASENSLSEDMIA